MFIREKQKSKKGVKYVQYQLIKSVRTPAGPRQEIVLNMGQELDVPKEQWKNLANAIEEKLLKTNALFSYDAETDKLADHYARLIEKNILNQKNDMTKSEPQPITTPSKSVTPNYMSIDVESIEHGDSRSYGCEALIDSVMKTYKFDTILEELNFTESQIQYSKMLIGARMLHPSSERETARWLNVNSTLPEFVGKNGTISDNGLHRAATLLWKNHEIIEGKLADTSKDLFSLGEKVILYDLTNTYFESSKENSSLAQYGKSKEKRKDCPLITLALTVDEEGFPKQSKIYKGNIGEASTLEDILKGLYTSSLGEKETIVLDAGIATEENLSLITSAPYNYSYIAVSRKQSYPETYWSNSTSEEIILSDNAKLTILAERTENEVFLLCKSDRKKEKENAIYERRMRKFEEGLKYLHEGLEKKRRSKKYDTILEKIGRLKQLYHVGKFYTIDIERNGETVVKIDFTRNKLSYEHERNRGSYVLRTNRTDLDNSEISQIHRSLTTIEDSFKSMKSHLGLRPIFHQTDYNSEAHIHITVLAYHFVIAILKQLRRKNIFYNWNSIREQLQSHQRVSTTMAAEDGSVIRLRQNTLPNKDQKNIFHAMGTMMKQGLKRVKNIFNPKM